MKEKVRSVESAEELWKVVDNAFEVIYNRQSVSLKYQQLFDVYHVLTISDFGSKVREWQQQSFLKIASHILQKITVNRTDKVASLNKELTEYSNLIDKVQKIAVYWDSRYAIPQRLPTTQFIGFQVIQKLLVGSFVLEEYIVEILSSIDLKRQDKYHDYLLLRTAISNLVAYFYKDRPRI